MNSVDVVVPCYKYGHFLRECVESVLVQDGPKVRVLIIDDASPDNTAAVASDLVRADSRVTFHQHTVNKGHIATYNEGIEWASADYFLILSADDYLLPGALNRSAALMDTNPQVGFTFGKFIELDGRRTTKQTGGIFKAADVISWQIVEGPKFIALSGSRNIVPTPTAVVRTDLQKRVGGYRPELPHSGDMEMWLRLAAQSSVGILNSYQAVYRRHSGNMSLLYMTKGWLPDLHQRKAALDFMFTTCGDTVPSASQLHQRSLRLLALDAVAYATVAFNTGELQISEQLSDFGTELCPQVRNSWSWMKLKCKRRLGFKVWRRLRPAVLAIRQGIWPLQRLHKFTYACAALLVRNNCVRSFKHVADSSQPGGVNNCCEITVESQEKNI
jgi:glycosyltransferase involved in cell wall biosynthesis